MPTCSSTSHPSRVRSVTACRAAAITISSPSQGAQSLAEVGSIATPSPSRPLANTSSGASSSGVLQPASGASSLTVRTAPSWRELHPVDRPRGIEGALGEAETQVVRSPRTRHRHRGELGHGVVVGRRRERQHRDRISVAGVEAHLDSCDGDPVAVLPLTPAADNDAVTELPPVSVAGARGAHDLCFRFTQRTLDPLWAIDWVQLSP